MPPPRHAPLSDYRVLILDNDPRAAVDSEIAAAIDSLAERLSSVGASVTRQNDALPDPGHAYDTYVGILMTVVTRGSGAQSMPAHDFLGLIDAQARIRRAWASVFESYDVAIAPAFGSVAFPHDDEPDQEKRRLTINGKAEPFFPQAAWPGLASLPHLPSTAVPIGQSRGGLPIGVQIVGPYLEDLTTIAFAGLIEREFGGFTPPPGY
ncbi:MAG: amidase family protein [Sphingomonadales bacterium]